MTQEARTQTLSPLKQALLAIDDLTARLDAGRRARSEPIAVIGMGCRFPGGADDPEAFWRILRAGVDAVREVPADRWDVERVFDADPDAPGKSYARKAGFLEGVDRFDPQFFGISPREAQGMDPQQRLLLEVAWEALEHAGQAPDRLGESATGVFVGMASSDYASLQLKAQDPARFGAYYGSGVARSVAAGRISYVLGLRGPSVSVDTACSSSLVAVHLACQSLHADECRMTLAAGVNLILSPENGISFAKSRMVAPDGRCKVFDGRADGFVDGEGCGVVVLKRLSHAIADGDRVLALIRGSAINQDGASSGLTAPNGPAQTEVIRAALRQGDVAPADVDYVEAHGTGTSLGDPIEVQALGAALREGRPADRPVLIGSLKANIGHAEAAAGVAGLIKVVLALQHGEIPGQANFETPSPHIPWADLPVRVVARPTPWPAGPRRRTAGVSAFGFSGTNAHVVLEEAPAVPVAAPGMERSAHLMTLSARSDAALAELAGRFARRLDADPGLALGDVAFTANVGRASFAHRAAIRAATLDDARRALSALAAGEAAPGLATGQLAGPDAPRVAFLFSGQGSQYAGMGRELYDTQPVFRQALDRCAELLGPEIGRSLLPVLFGEAGAGDDLGQTAFTQPALFALEYALAETWRSFGVEPAAVLGHSVGEYAAACVAGALSLEDAARLVAVRGRLMQSLPPGGAMAAVFAPEARVAEALAAHPDRVSIAAVNGAEHVVISGAGEAVGALVASLSAAGVRTQALAVSHAFHSALMDPVLDRLGRVAGTLSPARPRIAWVSNVTGRPVGGPEEIGAAYWRRHARQAVRFADGIRTLWEQGYRLFVEIGPGTTLVGMGRTTEPGAGAAWLASLRRGRPEWTQLLDTLGELWTRGAAVDWAGFDRGYGRRRVALPPTPFERARYWIDPPAPGAAPPPASAAVAAGGHPLLGRRLRSPLGPAQFETAIGASAPPYLGEHRVHGTPVLPASGFVEMLVAGGAETLGGEAWRLEGVALDEALVLPEDGVCPVQTVVGPVADGVASCEVWSLPAGAAAGAWRRHASARMRRLEAEPASVSLDEVRARCTEEVPVEALYAELVAAGVAHGPAFRGLARLWRADGEALAEIRLGAGVDAASYRAHPCLLDACLQPIAAALSPAERAGSYMPVAVERLDWRGRPAARAWSHVRLTARPGDGGALTADVRVVDDSGALLIAIEGLRLVRASPEALARLGRVRDLLYTVQWRPAPLPEGAGRPAAADLAEPAAIAAEVTVRIEDVRARQGLDAYEGIGPELDAVSSMYVARALHELGWAPAPGDPVSAGDLAGRLHVAPRHEALLARFLEILAEDGILRQAGGGWIATRALDPRDPAARLALLRDRHPEAWAEIAITERCGASLAGALSGRIDPLDLLFPGGSTETAEALYTASPPARACGELVAAAVAVAVRELPAGRPLRVLEVGGGTGGTTAAVLPALPRERTEYVFTDVSPAFTSRAGERFREWPFLRTRPLDLERDPLEQGFAAHAFDLVIAANVVHATRDLRRTLDRCRRLMAPGALLVLLEVTAPQRWIDLTFGLTEGWWHFTDRDLRPGYPLLSAARWRELLAERGFAEAAAVPPVPAGAGTFAANTVLVARAPREALAADRAAWLVVGDVAGVGEGLAAALENRGQRAVLARTGTACGARSPGEWSVRPGVSGDLVRLVAEAHGGAGWRGVVHCRAIDAPEGERGADLDGAQRDACGSLLDLVNALATPAAASAPTAPAVPPLWLVTRGAQPVGEGKVAVSQAPALGLARTIALEHPELRCARIDLDPAGGPPDVSALAAELLAADAEDEVAYRGGVRHVARLTARPEPDRPDGGETGVLKVVTGTAGSLDSLMLRPANRRSPGPGEVEIEVRATGLNFKDVLNVLGMYPGDPGPLGSECAGTITAVGPLVAGLQPGQAVVAVAPGSFATHVTTGAGLVAPKPADMSFEEAASLPIAFVTAWYALRSVADLQAGERVLIHAAAGGVGLAAVQLARSLGAEVFATAGSADKRAYLRSTGIEHVFDSRTATFAAEVLAHTGGRGVDVVLNSLTGDMIPASLDAMAAPGRFLEIGKRGIWTPAEVARLRPAAAYHVIDWGEVARQEPARIQAVFADVLQAFRTAALRPLPRRVFPLRDVSGAFRYMAQARHIGKVVVNVEPRTSRHQPAPVIRADASYVITGGLGGLGLAVAGWLVRGGARAIVLLGRRAADGAAEAAIDALRAEGAEVRVIEADVSSARDLDRALAEARATMPPIRGVVHAAGVLDDGVLLQQDWARFARVMAAKVAGASHLHTLTRGDDIDMFVLFSSVASLLGSPGQGNHAAANAYLDALAHHRRAIGLHGLSINWGAWSEVGSAAREDRERRIQQQGIGAMTPAEGLAALSAALEGGWAQVAAVAVDWPRFLGRHAGQRPLSLLADLAGPATSGRSERPAERRLDERLAEAPAARRRPLLVAHVASRVGRVLALEPAHVVDTGRPLNEMGLDSLMAVELRNVLRADLGQEGALPATLVFDYPTVEAIAGFLARDVLGFEPAATGDDDAAAAEPGDSLDQIEQLSDDEVDRLFAERLGGVGA